MMKIRTLAGTVFFLSTSLLSGAAFAQDQSGSADPAAAASAPAPAQPAAPAQAPAAPPNPQVATFVDQQFPSADVDKDGKVTATEFIAWIASLKTAEQQKAGQVDAAAAKTYADNALAKADIDKDGALTKTELVKFFGG
jgi:hypothetical protein